MSSVTPPVLYLLPTHTPSLHLPNRYGLGKRPLEVMVNFTWAASPDERNTEVAQNWDPWKDRKSGPSRDPGMGLSKTKQW
jgi:hypothetical protein